jgi:hypothetical protein
MKISYYGIFMCGLALLMNANENAKVDIETIQEWAQKTDDATIHQIRESLLSKPQYNFTKTLIALYKEIAYRPETYVISFYFNYVLPFTKKITSYFAFSLPEKDEVTFYKNKQEEQIAPAIKQLYKKAHQDIADGFHVKVMKAADDSKAIAQAVYDPRRTSRNPGYKGHIEINPTEFTIPSPYGADELNKKIRTVLRHEYVHLKNEHGIRTVEFIEAIKNALVKPDDQTKMLHRLNTAAEFEAEINAALESKSAFQDWLDAHLSDESLITTPKEINGASWTEMIRLIITEVNKKDIPPTKPSSRLAFLTASWLALKNKSRQLADYLSKRTSPSLFNKK